MAIRRGIQWALSLCLVVTFSGVLTAASIPVSNASFEDPVLAAGAWSDVNQDWGDDAGSSGAEFTEHIVGFVADGLNHTGMNAGAMVSQDTGVSLLNNNDYTLTVAIGNRGGSTVAGNASTYGLFAGGPAGVGTLLASGAFDASVIPASSFADISVTYHANGNPPAGDVWISLQALGEGRSHFDNVRLEVVPEPATATLAALAAFGCLGIVRRRRR